MALVPGYFASMFGDQTLLIASIDTDDGRDIAVQSPARGSRHYLQDRGAKLGRADCEILFVDEPGKASYLERFARFRALVARGEPQIFSHPLLGTYRARAEGGRHTASSDSRQIRFQCAFLPEDQPQPTAPTGGGVAPVAGAEAVKVAAAAVAAAAASAELPAGDPTRTWLDDLVAFFVAAADAVAVDSQEVLSGVAAFTGTIQTAIDDLELATRIERWPLYQALIHLLSAVQRGREALTSDTGSRLSFFVGRPLPLLAICAEVYGPELAADRADQVMRMNRVRTPSRVPAGTTLLLPAPGAA